MACALGNRLNLLSAAAEVVGTSAGGAVGLPATTDTAGSAVAAGGMSSPRVLTLCSAWEDKTIRLTGVEDGVRLVLEFFGRYDGPMLAVTETIFDIRKLTCRYIRQLLAEYRSYVLFFNTVYHHNEKLCRCPGATHQNLSCLSRFIAECIADPGPEHRVLYFYKLCPSRTTPRVQTGDFHLGIVSGKKELCQTCLDTQRKRQSRRGSAKSVPHAALAAAHAAHARSHHHHPRTAAGAPAAIGLADAVTAAAAAATSPPLSSHGAPVPVAMPTAHHPHPGFAAIPTTLPAALPGALPGALPVGCMAAAAMSSQFAAHAFAGAHNGLASAAAASGAPPFSVGGVLGPFDGAASGGGLAMVPGGMVTPEGQPASFMTMPSGMLGPRKRARTDHDPSHTHARGLAFLAGQHRAGSQLAGSGGGGGGERRGSESPPALQPLTGVSPPPLSQAQVEAIIGKLQLDIGFAAEVWQAYERFSGSPEPVTFVVGEGPAQILSRSDMANPLFLDTALNLKGRPYVALRVPARRAHMDAKENQAFLASHAVFTLNVPNGLGIPFDARRLSGRLHLYPLCLNAERKHLGIITRPDRHLCHACAEADRKHARRRRPKTPQAAHARAPPPDMLSPMVSLTALSASAF